MIAGILLGIEAVVLLIIFILKSKKKTDLQVKRNKAASQLLKQEILTNMISLNGLQNNNKWHLLVEILFYDGREKRYVLDPINGIRFGRSYFTNDVAVEHERVSANHCMLFLNQGKLFLQNLGASNGTFLVRNGKKYQVQTTADIQSGDVLDLCGIRFRITPFWVDTTEI